MNQPIITSLLNQDLYKLTMQQVVLHRFPFVNVAYDFKLRTPGIDLTPYTDEILEQIRHLGTLRITPEEERFLRSIYYLNPAYVDTLTQFQLPTDAVEITTDSKGQFALHIAGNWFQTIWFEVFILAIINEIYYRHTNGRKIPAGGRDRLLSKIETMKRLEGGDIFKLIEFGTRRRYSAFWQEYVLAALLDEVPQCVLGTSNVALAMKYDLKPYGTMAHEYLQACQALAPLHRFQQFALQTWAEEYRGSLGIALSDVVGMDAFLQDFDRYFAMLFEGARHDSGDPFVWGEKLIRHYESLGIDPATKSAVFSDGLTIEGCIALHRYFRNRLRVSFGVGTSLTNDHDQPPLSMVIKMTRCDGRPVAKLSDSPGKTMCQDHTYLDYLRSCFTVPEAPYQKPYLSAKDLLAFAETRL